jgi:hypothetical protein
VALWAKVNRWRWETVQPGIARCAHRVAKILGGSREPFFKRVPWPPEAEKNSIVDFLFLMYYTIIVFETKTGEKERDMYLVEKIGNLILITVEGEITDKEVENIKSQLTKVAEMAKDDVIVSFNLGNGITGKMTFTLENKINQLLKFCHLSGLRVYSYRSG